MRFEILSSSLQTLRNLPARAEKRAKCPRCGASFLRRLGLGVAAGKEGNAVAVAVLVALEHPAARERVGLLAGHLDDLEVSSAGREVVAGALAVDDGGDGRGAEVAHRRDVAGHMDLGDEDTLVVLRRGPRTT